MWAKQNATGKGSIRYPKLIASDPYTYCVIRLEEEEEAMIASAFLRWKKTWNHNGFGWDIDYHACKDALQRSKLKKNQYIDLMYDIKEAWIGAERGKRTQNKNIRQ